MSVAATNHRPFQIKGCCDLISKISQLSFQSFTQPSIIIPSSIIISSYLSQKTTEETKSLLVQEIHFQNNLSIEGGRILHSLTTTLKTGFSQLTLVHPQKASFLSLTKCTGYTNAILDATFCIELLPSNRECIVICTHSHFDHSGGAHHFDHVLIHRGDYEGLSTGDESATLNWSHPPHYRAQPCANVSADQYKVLPTKCTFIEIGHQINLGGGDDDEITIMHVPGHTPGSIVCYYPRKRLYLPVILFMNVELVAVDIIICQHHRSMIM